MGCEAFDDRLLDFVSGDLSADDEKEMRAHVARCEACREAHLRLATTLRISAELPVVEPRRDLDDPILAAARAKIARSSSPTPSPAPRPSLLETLRNVVLGPQFAMATVMVLVVAFGIFAIPGLRRDPSIDGRPRLALEAEESAPAAAQPMADEAPAELALRSVAGIAPEGEESAREEARPRAFAGKGEAAARKRSAPSSAGALSERKAGAPADALGSLDDELADRGGPKSAPAPRRSATEAFPAAPAAPGVMPKETSKAARADIASSPEASIASGGAAPPRAEPASSTIVSTHALARQKASEGSASEALAAYRTVLAAGASYPGRGEALLEMADLLIARQRVEEAEMLLREAASRPETAARARARLERLAATR